MATEGGPNIITDGLILALDAANIKSFRGEPTTNLTINDSNFIGTNYSPDTEWTSSPTVFTKSFNSLITTPIGTGATLLSESGNSGYHHLSRWGGGGFGNHSLSCYILPLSNNITNFTIGLLADGGNNITFNLNTKTITYGSGAVPGSAFIEEVEGFPGWLRVGGNHGGRNGGWVGCVGLSSNVIYTGAVNGRPFYITGLQYETTPRTTRFTPAQTTRGTTVATGGGWIDKSGNNNHGELVNGPTYDSANGGSIVFDGVDDYVTFGSPNMTSSCTVNQWIQPLSGSAATMRTIEYVAVNSATAVLYSQLIKISNIWYHQTLVSGYQAGYAQEMNMYFKSNVNQFVQNNTPYNFSFTWERTPGVNSTLKTYLNGVFKEQLIQTNDYWANTASLSTGTYRISNTYKGNISTTSFYNRALTSEEVLQNYNATKARFGL